MMKINQKLLPRLIFLGPPGCGKGTQAQILSKELNINHISTGDIIRRIIKENKPAKIAKQIKKYVEEGLLVPDKVVFDALKVFLKNAKGFILDGYPRNLSQVKQLEKFFKNNKGIDFVLYFKISNKEIIKRLTSRRTCPKCGKVYNIYTLKPKRDNLCDICNVELIVREDDKVSTVKKRLQVYKQETSPLIDYYKSKNLLITINAALPVEKVTENIKKVICK
ncbi:MAG: nucleoside monophosphate kinase [Endomicrobia bacterium]|nr:nucleoside monophosphate kinase [Endomicrobiia bacterium]